jgi:hypothetical protein
MVVLGAASWLVLQGSESAIRGALGFVLGIAAAPLMLATGVPVRAGSSAMWIGIGASALLWLTVGAIASWRATRRPVADWSDYRRELRWLIGGVWSGVALAAAGAAVFVGVALW